MLTYHQFIDELRPLLGQAQELAHLKQLHEDPAFRKWRHEVTDLLERIEQATYSINCSIRERLFDERGSYAYSPTPSERLAAYDRDLQDTIVELGTIISRFEKFGDPKSEKKESAAALVDGVQRVTQDPTSSSLAENIKKHWLISVVLICAAVSGSTWKVLDEVLVRPRDFRITTLEKQVGDLASEKLHLEKQIADTTRELTRSRDDKTTSLQSGRNEVIVDFPWVDTASAPGFIVAAAPYLHGVGISVVDVKPPGSEVVLVNNRGIYGGQAVKPTTSQNVLTQINTGNAPASFTLRFSDSFRSVSFIRPALYAATESGVTHPAWSAQALDSSGHEISSQREGLTRCWPRLKCNEIPAQRYTLGAPGFEGIRAIRFDSDPRLDGKPFAGTSAILIERLSLTPQNK